MKLLSLGLGLVLMMSSSAFAGSNGALSLTDMKDKCAELGGNQQLKPFKAVVSCTSRSTQWRASEYAPLFELLNVAEIGVSARMKGYQMAAQTFAVPVSPTASKCVVLEKWQITVPAVEVELTCEELMAIDDFVHFCAPLIEAKVFEDPSLQIEELTAEVFNSCDYQASPGFIGRQSK